MHLRPTGCWASNNAAGISHQCILWIYHNRPKYVADIYVKIYSCLCSLCVGWNLFYVTENVYTENDASDLDAF